MTPGGKKKRKNRTEELVRQVYGDPIEDDEGNWPNRSAPSRGNRGGGGGGGDGDFIGDPNQHHSSSSHSRSSANSVVTGEEEKPSAGSRDDVREADDKKDEEKDDDAPSSFGSVEGSVASSNNRAEVAKEDSQLKSMYANGQGFKILRTWRIVVMLCLTMTAIATCLATYVVLTKEEESQYQTAYADVTGTIESAAPRNVESLRMAMMSLSDVATQLARSENMTWPFVTLTKNPFEVAGKHARDQSGAEFLTLAPLVYENHRKEWVKYSTENFEGWWKQSKLLFEKMSPPGSYNSTASGDGTCADNIVRPDGSPSPRLRGNTPHLPVWQTSPPPRTTQIINVDMHLIPEVQAIIPALDEYRTGLFTHVFELSGAASLALGPEEHLAYHQQFSSVPLTANSSQYRPHSLFLIPVLERLHDKGSKMVGVLISTLAWDRYLAGLVPDSVSGIMVELTNSCNESFTYILKGNRSNYLGPGDFRGLAIEETRYVVDLFAYEGHHGAQEEEQHDEPHCDYSLVVYSTKEFKGSASSSTAIMATLTVAGVSVMVLLTFLVYDCYVRRRNAKLVEAAVRSDQILTSLFPSNVRSRLFEAHKAEPGKDPRGRGGGGGAGVVAKNRLLNFLTDGNEVNDKAPDVKNSSEFMGYEGKPIADLFTDTTILCADIAGFTAWSSVREPAQVFTLLEALYREFDSLANKRKVFKVETVGDCYVAVAGLPEPRKDHGLVMARFAQDCMNRMLQLVKVLEVSLGPDTGDLALRIGLHSGPVTAGVLRGERSRFQLFGDTMRETQRMESTGVRCRIQCSQDTADLLIASGKERWLEPRQDKVHAKGKGEMQTYWVQVGSGPDDASRDNEGAALAAYAQASTNSVRRTTADDLAADKTQRLIEWNVEVLLRLLKQVEAKRQAKQIHNAPEPLDEKAVLLGQIEGKTVIDEVKEIVNLPRYKARDAIEQQDADSVELSSNVVSQLRDYVTNIAALYNSNPFHNFEHASHVTMSVTKLLSRIIAPADVQYDENHGATGKALHDHTYGITSDPLTQFACVFSALIHDVDHSGVPNAQLVKEMSPIAQFYNNQSAAEQNSVDLAWALLMDPDYADLRRTIYWTESELKRFRQLVVNSVMATDIVDKDLKTLRNARWAKAFSDEAVREDETEKCRTNRKATIVIEHLIQASDVSHTMQHWHIYRKWNEMFFAECYRAYVEGRADADPSVGWYQGEMGFYDFYIIPLARKLKDCGVFGVSSDEYLNYAIRNRQEWEEKGQIIVSEMVERVRQQYWYTSSAD